MLKKFFNSQQMRRGPTSTQWGEMVPPSRSGTRQGCPSAAALQRQTERERIKEALQGVQETRHMRLLITLTCGVRTGGGPLDGRTGKRTRTLQCDGVGHGLLMGPLSEPRNYNNVCAFCDHQSQFDCFTNRRAGDLGVSVGLGLLIST